MLWLTETCPSSLLTLQLVMWNSNAAWSSLVRMALIATQSAGSHDMLHVPSWQADGWCCKEHCSVPARPSHTPTDIRSCHSLTNIFKGVKLGSSVRHLKILHNVRVWVKPWLTCSLWLRGSIYFDQLNSLVDHQFCCLLLWDVGINGPIDFRNTVKIPVLETYTLLHTARMENLYLLSIFGRK